jgi:hypothetical protein
MLENSAGVRLAIAAGAALVFGALFSGSALGQVPTLTPTATVTGTVAPAVSPTVTNTPPAVTATVTATVTITTTPVVVTATPTTTPTAPAMIRDARYFAQTGFRVDNDVVWDYFNRRGGVTTFGYPVSRTFLFRGVQVQFFQRRVVEIGPNGQARQANLLDPELMPYTRVNGANFPAADPAVTSAAPAPTDANATIAFVQGRAPDRFNERTVNFYQTFANTVPFQVAFPNGGDPNLLTGINLEMWGIPTSNPAADPNNANFIYQRWQRGIMHYRAECNCTEAILLADYLKAIITGQNLPGDLDQQAQSSPFYKQYDPSQPQWVKDRARLPNTDMTSAFVQG